MYNHSPPKIANIVSTPYFIKSAWNGYSEDIDKKYGFTLALEWYLDSWSSSILESQFLSAATCLEMLMDKFHSNNNSENILPEEKFSKFQKDVKECVREKAITSNIESTTRGLFYDKLGRGLNRRTFVNKAEMLLDFWGIKYADLGISLNEIVRIRNDITHRGQHAEDKERQEMFSIYKSLNSIILRILLAMINFDWEYWDVARQESIKFESVCTKQKTNN